jgi:hypothetical protein
MPTFDLEYRHKGPVAGIDEVCYTSEQAFDASADNLMTYYTQVLQDVKK